MTNLKSLLKLTLGAAALSAMASGSAYAAGTAADTNVQNTFSLDYKVGGVDQPTIDTGPGGSNTPTEFTVDRLVDLTVASTANATVVPGAQDEELVFSLTNNGNDTQAYVLDLFNENEGGAAADEFDASGLNITYYFDVGTPGVFDATDQAGTAYTYTPGSGTATQDLPPDALIWIVVDGDIPTTATVATLNDGDNADITLLADTVEPSTAGVLAGTPVNADADGNSITGAAENVLADGESLSDGTYDRENANNGDHAATSAYIISSADLVADKAVGIVSEDGTGCAGITFPLVGATPPNNGHAVPGACIEYRITVQNTGSSSATDLVLADTLPTSLTFIDADHDGFTGGTFSAPATNTDCGVSACTISLTGTATIGAASTGVVAIRALVK